MNDNPNGITKYCSDCIFFKKRFSIYHPFDRNAYALCSKEEYKDDNDYTLIHPKYKNVYYMRAVDVRRSSTRCSPDGKWWEPKNKEK
jgi:hypothetical protein